MYSYQCTEVGFVSFLLGEYAKSRTSEANGQNSSNWTRPFVGLSKTLKMIKIKSKILKNSFQLDNFIDRR